MMIVQRKTGAVLHADPVPPEKRQQWWENYIRETAPDVLKKLLEQEGGEFGGVPTHCG